jgi:hypothetical protein
MFQAFQENASIFDKPPLNTCWVIPGRLLDGGYPGHPNDTMAWDNHFPFMECGNDHIQEITEPEVR